MRTWLAVAGVAVLLGWLLMWGCAPQISPVVQAEAEAAAVAAADQELYQLGPEDVVEVSVWKEPELTRQLIVRPDGKISYPLIGEIPAAGRTVRQLQEDISKRLEKFVTDAAVTVILLKAQHYKFFVTGKVNRPGEFVVGRPTTVLQALAMAGGLTPFASPSNILVVRKVGGQDQVFRFNYRQVARGQMLEQNIVLLPGDVVVVP